MKQLKILLLTGIITLFTTFANATPVNITPIISYLLSDSTTSMESLLGGKTFYVVGQDVNNLTDIWAGAVTFNADLTELTFLNTYGPDIGVEEIYTISINGDRLVILDDIGAAYTVIGENVGDYIEVTDYHTEGTIESHTRFYYDEAKATVYLESIAVVCEGAVTHNGTDYCTVVSPYTGKTWLDRNLGAGRVCESFNDSACYGDYYQWGRSFDGHQASTSRTTTVQATDVYDVGHGDFIISPNIYDYDWASVDGTGAIRSINWSTTDGSSICPFSFRTPTMEELNAELLDVGSAEILNGYDAFNTFLKLPLAGYHDYNYGGVYSQGLWGPVWTSSVDSYHSNLLNIDLNQANEGISSRAGGYSVRCLKD